MELQQMRYVVAVAEERSFTRAAERCHIVQSAMSHQIKALEREIGVQLFARTSRRVDVTDAGRAFLPAARASIEAAERAIAEANTATGQLRGTLTIGVIPTVTAIDIPAILGIFRGEHPNVRVVLREGGSDDFGAAIAAGKIDVAILGLADGTPPRGVAFEELAREQLVAVLGPQHALAHRRRLRLADIANEDFVDFPSGGTGRAQSDLAFAKAGLRRNVWYEVSRMSLTLDLVRDGHAIALLPPGIVPAGDPLRQIALTHGPRRITYLAWSAFNPRPAATAFTKLVRKRPDSVR